MHDRVLTYITPKHKGKVVHAMKAQGRSRGKTSLILNFRTSWR
jgi:hypothetical protein